MYSVVEKKLNKPLLLGSIFSILLFTPVFAFAETGFLDTPIWLRPEKPTEGEMVTLSAAFRNEETTTLTSTITFTDGDIVLGKKELSLAPGILGTANVSFKISAGDHHFKASASNTVATNASGVKEAYTASLSQAVLPKVVISKKILTANTLASTEPVEVAANSILSHVPDSVQDKLLNTVGKVEDWRTETYVVYQAKKDTAHQDYLDTKTKKDGSKTDGPLAYAKYLMFMLLAYLFSTPVGFYVAGAVIIFVLIRFFMRRGRY